MTKTLTDLNRSLFPPIPKEMKRELRQVIPFYIILECGLVFLYIVALSNNPSLREPQRLVPFTLLMLLHGWLHWTSPRLVISARYRIWYLVVQGLLAFVLITIGRHLSLVFGLYISLIGEVFGALRTSRAGLTAILAYILLSGGGYVYLTTGIGFQLWVLTALPALGFTIAYVYLYTRQAQAREDALALAADLKAANIQLTEYAAQVEDLTIANERQRMARDLHDTLSQGLAGLILQLDAADAHLSSSRPEKAQTIVRQAMLQARQTLAEAREAIADLRQGQPLDLGEALRQETERFTQTTSIPCDFQVSLDEPLPEAVGEAMLRVITEALSNVARYAQAKRAWVHVRTGAGSLEAEIGDDGVGFNPETVTPGHYGLVGMRERVRLAGGRMEIDSAAGQGARLKIFLPLEEIKTP